MQAKWRSIQIIYLALVSGTILALIVLYAVREDRAPASTDIAQLEIIIPIVITLIVITTQFISWQQRKKFTERFTSQASRQEEILEYSNTEQKLTHAATVYLTAKTIQWAGLEGSGMALAVAYFISGQIEFIIAGLLAVLGLLFFRPKVAELAEMSQIPETEIERSIQTG
ncbi:MAG: hypothetical protein KDK30_06945 [Leptospiraceae bacterium]|nr:hypothetical protein [Leptospiraceae bacterium]MCB1315889.1 hypothetical protein [Leptospiraceae bacterium]